MSAAVEANIATTEKLLHDYMDMFCFWMVVNTEIDYTDNALSIDMRFMAIARTFNAEITEKHKKCSPVKL